MRLLNHDADAALDNLVLLLTQPEAAKLVVELQRLLATPEQTAHAHVLGEDDGQAHKEIALALYRPGQPDGLPERFQHLILTDS